MDEGVRCRVSFILLDKNPVKIEFGSSLTKSITELDKKLANAEVDEFVVVVIRLVVSRGKVLKVDIITDFGKKTLAGNSLAEKIELRSVSKADL